MFYCFHVYSVVLRRVYALQSDHRQSPCGRYSILGHIPCAVHYIPVTYLYHDRKFVPLVTLRLLRASPPATTGLFCL